MGPVLPCVPKKITIIPAGPYFQVLKGHDLLHYFTSIKDALEYANGCIQADEFNVKQLNKDEDND